METSSYHSHDLEQYILNHTTPEDAVLYELNRHTHLTSLQPRMLSGPIQGKFLEFLVRMIDPHRILEIGTYTGYSAICMARGMNPDALLHTIEINDEICETAAAFFKKAELEHRITLHIGDAIEIINKIDEVFDMVLIDGDKREYPEYLKLILPKVKSNGFIVADNVLWGEKVLLNLPDDEYTKGVMEFNEKVRSDQNLEQVLLPLRDGIMLIRKN